MGNVHSMRKAECYMYISIKAECTWQGNTLSVTESLSYLCTVIKPNILSDMILGKSLLVFSALYVCHRKCENNCLPLFCEFCFWFYINLIYHCSHFVVIYEIIALFFAFDPPMHNFDVYVSMCVTRFDKTIFLTKHTFYHHMIYV